MVLQHEPKFQYIPKLLHAGVLNKASQQNKMQYTLHGHKVKLNFKEKLIKSANLTLPKFSDILHKYFPVNILKQIWKKIIMDKKYYNIEVTYSPVV